MPVAQFDHNLIKLGKRKYRNPIYLAKEWRRVLDSGHCSSPATLARHLQVSRARVTQVLILLKLAPEVEEMIYSLGDPISSQMVAERRLRPLLGMAVEN